MGMTGETMARARDYAQSMRDLVRPATVVALRTRTNGYDYADRRFNETHLHAVDTVDAYGDRVIVLWPDGEIKGAESALYVIDDGRTTEAFFVNAYQTDDGSPLFIGACPLNFNPDGSRRMRADGRGPVDMSRWSLAPTRAYHVKLSRNIPALRDFNTVQALAS